MDIKALAQDAAPYVVERRHYYHQHPELTGEEKNTRDAIHRDLEALGITDTRIEISEDKVSFPWFETIPSPEELDAYTKFIAALCEMSVKTKRVTAKEKEVDNDKYAFRCFLLRLGFIGDEYKTDRKILMRYLPGNSAFKGGEGHAISK